MALVPSGPAQGQPASSPIHATSWTVRRAIDGGREIVVPKGTVVVFDWTSSFGDPTSEDASAVFVYDGCTTSSGVFAWHDRGLAMRAVRDLADTCTTPPRKAIRKALAGSFDHDPLGDIRTGSVLKLTSGRKTIELIRRAESRLRGTVWHPLGTKTPADARLVAGQIEFQATSFTANDGCNSIKGIYVDTRGRLLLLGRPVMTAVACERPSFGRQGIQALVEGQEPKVTVTERNLTITSGNDVFHYQKVSRTAG